MVLVSYILGSLLFIPVSLILNYPNFSFSRSGMMIFIVVGILGVPLFWGMYEGAGELVHQELHRLLEVICLSHHSSG